jgi:hypothetical protein
VRLNGNIFLYLDGQTRKLLAWKITLGDQAKFSYNLFPDTMHVFSHFPNLQFEYLFTVRRQQIIQIK